jgi:hypothetical protein
MHLSVSQKPVQGETATSGGSATTARVPRRTGIRPVLDQEPT